MRTKTLTVPRFTGLLSIICLIAIFTACGNKKPGATGQSTETWAIGKETANTILKEKEIDGKPVEHYLSDPDIDPKLLAYVHGEFQPADNPETLQLVDTLVHHDGELEPLYFSCFMQICKQADNELADALVPLTCSWTKPNTRWKN